MELNIGTITIGKTVYKAVALNVGEASSRNGVLGHYSLTGPRGAMFFVTDHGRKYMPNAIAIGSKNRPCYPRPMQGITRDHLDMLRTMRDAVVNQIQPAVKR